jgi:hypothetical protein
MSYFEAMRLIDEAGLVYGVKHVQNKPRVSSMPYTYDIAEGNVTNHTSWSKIGYHAAIDTTELDMRPYAAATAGIGWSYTFPTAELTMTIASTSAKDCQRALTAFADSGTSPGTKTTVTCTSHGLANADSVIIQGTTHYNGTFVLSNVTTHTFDIIIAFAGNDATGTVRGPGANTITVYYLNAAFEEKTATVTMLGTTAVQVATDIYRIQNVRVATAGPSLVTVGAVSIISAGQTYGYISLGRTRGRQCIWTVPLGKTLYVTSIAFSSAQQTASKYVRFTTKANYDDKSGTVLQRGLFMPFNEVVLNNTAYFRELNPPTRLPATTDLKVTALSDSVAIGTCTLRGWTEST